jgi:hypothetical protein
LLTVIVRVADPFALGEMLTLAGLTDAAILLLVGLTAALRLTVPANPPIETTVMLQVAVPPALGKLTVVGVTVIAKSGVGVFVTVGVLVRVGVLVIVGVFVGVFVAARVGVFVGVLVGVRVGVLVGVFVGVGVQVGVLVTVDVGRGIGVMGVAHAALVTGVARLPGIVECPASVKAEPHSPKKRLWV